VLMVHCVARSAHLVSAHVIGGSNPGPKEGRDGHEESEDAPPIQVYHLFDHDVLVADGECALSNTGWRTWAGSWMLAKHLEKELAKNAQLPPCSRGRGGEALRVLDLSCGTGLLGISLACAGHEVVLCDLDINVGTVRANIERNICGARASHARVVGYAWGRLLPDAMSHEFDIVACGDLLYHVWSGRLQVEFLHTLQEIYRLGAGEFIFGFQVRSSRQEQAVLDAIQKRLHLVAEELQLDVDPSEASPLSPEMKYRLVRLRRPRPHESMEKLHAAGADSILSDVSDWRRSPTPHHEVVGA